MVGMRLRRSSIHESSPYGAVRRSAPLWNGTESPGASRLGKAVQSTALEFGPFSNVRSCLPSANEFVALKTLRNDANSEVAERQRDGSQGLQPLVLVRIQGRRGATPEPVRPWFVDDTFATRSSVAPRRSMKNDPKPWAEAHGYHHRVAPRRVRNVQTPACRVPRHLEFSDTRPIPMAIARRWRAQGAPILPQRDRTHPHARRTAPVQAAGCFQGAR